MTSVDGAENGRNKDGQNMVVYHQAANSPPQSLIEPRPGSQTLEYDDVRMIAARLYGKGYNRMQIARILIDHLAPDEDASITKRQKQALKTLRQLEVKDWFRDLVYTQAVGEMDMKIPGILRAMAGRAKHRVDAARLILEVTGRHNPKGETQPPNITVQIANIPRPE
jgi:hypothetical protein